MIGSPLIEGKFVFRGFNRWMAKGGKFAGKYLSRIDPLEWRELCSILERRYIYFSFSPRKVAS